MDAKSHKKVAEFAVANAGESRTVGGRITSYCVQEDEEAAKIGAKGTVPTTLKAYRMKVCYAFLLDNVKFTCLRNTERDGVRILLEDGRGTFPVNSVTACIPDVQVIIEGELLEQLKKAKAIAIVSDGTPFVAEAFGVIARWFAPSGRIMQKIIALKMYSSSFKHEQLQTAIIRIFNDNYHVPSTKIHVIVSDGCPVDGAALRPLEGLLPKHGRSNLHITRLKCRWENFVRNPSTGRRSSRRNGRK